MAILSYPVVLNTWGVLKNAEISQKYVKKSQFCTQITGQSRSKPGQNRSNLDQARSSQIKSDQTA